MTGCARKRLGSDERRARFADAGRDGLQDSPRPGVEFRSADHERGTWRALTTVIDGLDGDERYYAGLVAEHLGIPIHFRDRSGKLIDPDWEVAHSDARNRFRLLQISLGTEGTPGDGRV